MTWLKQVTVKSLVQLRQEAEAHVRDDMQKLEMAWLADQADQADHVRRWQGEQILLDLDEATCAEDIMDLVWSDESGIFHGFEI